MSPLKRIAVIGGGISGLAAAWQLSRASNVETRLLEASDRVGGVLETMYDQGYLIERSADNFATLIPDALEFCRETGFESQLIRPHTVVSLIFPYCTIIIIVRATFFSPLPPVPLDTHHLHASLIFH